MIKYSNEDIEYIRNLILTNKSSTGQTIHQLSAGFGITYDAARCVIRKYANDLRTNKKFRQMPLFKAASPKPIQRIEKVEQAEEKTLQSLSPKTLEEVVKELGINNELYAVKNFKVEGPKQNGTYIYAVSFEKKPVDPSKFADEFLAKVNDHCPKTFNILETKGAKDCMYLLNLQDAHVGKLGWSEETGWANYDYKIAKEIYTNALIDLISKVPQDRVEEIWLIVGSDLIQVESPKNLTTAGTPVSADTRWHKIYGAACDLMTESIELLASKFKIKAIVVPGNHANISEYCLGTYLKAWFRHHTNVSIINDPNSRKYARYGKTGFMFYHGDKNLKNTASLFISEFKSELGNCKWLEVIQGDKHQERVTENRGIKERIAPSLSGADSWHAENGFVGNVRNAQGLLYNKDFGVEAIYYSKPVE